MCISNCKKFCKNSWNESKKQGILALTFDNPMIMIKLKKMIGLVWQIGFFVSWKTVKCIISHDDGSKDEIF